MAEYGDDVAVADDDDDDDEDDDKQWQNMATT